MMEKRGTTPNANSYILSGKKTAMAIEKIAEANTEND
jgi:hypothetical protein